MQTRQYLDVCTSVFMSRIAIAHNNDLLHNQVCWVPLEYKSTVAYGALFHLFSPFNNFQSSFFYQQENNQIQQRHGACKSITAKEWNSSLRRLLTPKRMKKAVLDLQPHMYFLSKVLTEAQVVSIDHDNGSSCPALRGRPRCTHLDLLGAISSCSSSPGPPRRYQSC